MKIYLHLAERRFPAKFTTNSLSKLAIHENIGIRIIVQERAS